MKIVDNTSYLLDMMDIDDILESVNLEDEDLDSIDESYGNGAAENIVEAIAALIVMNTMLQTGISDTLYNYYKIPGYNDFIINCTIPGMSVYTTKYIMQNYSEIKQDISEKLQDMINIYEKICSETDKKYSKEKPFLPVICKNILQKAKSIKKKLDSK